MITSQEIKKRLIFLACIKTIATTLFLLFNNYVLAATILLTLLITITWIIRIHNTQQKPSTIWRQVHISIGLPILIIGISTLLVHIHTQALMKTLIGILITTKGILHK